MMVNLLPIDGYADYYGQVMNTAQATQYLDRLLQDIEWRNDEAVIFGRHIVTKRKVAWYGDNTYTYTYSNITRQALPWTEDLLALKELTEKLTGARYNSCLLNLYHDGDEGMAWHSDDEKELEPGGAIASLSFGAERRFLLRHRETKQLIEVSLAPGSLLVMRGTTQTHWLHSLPKMKKVRTPRINLTFRTMLRAPGDVQMGAKRRTETTQTGAKRKPGHAQAKHAPGTAGTHTPGAGRKPGTHGKNFFQV